MVQARQGLSLAVSLAIVLALGYSAWRGIPHSWRLMRSQHAQYATYTRAERDQAFGALVPIRMDIFDFWARSLRPGDRYWIQIPPEGFSATADKKLVVRSIAHLYLLPAIETRRLSDANVVLSWDSDPGLLGLHYSAQVRAGAQLIFVSRIARGS
ncbi:MAG: hypothetical protein ACJ757_12070 [Gaiellaceae bacterium]